jgi:hypothetical protein
MSRPPKHTRTGKLLDAPDESALYAFNPCPRAALLPKKDLDYTDEGGRQYWDAMEHESLRAWVEKSAVLSEVVQDSYDKDSNFLFFVKQSKTQKENKEAFTLPDEGEQVTLTHAKHPDISLLARVLRVGNSSSSYTARSVRWMLVVSS